MIFARLYDEGEGQILVTIEQDEDEQWGIGVRTWVDEVGIVHGFYRIENREMLQKSFDMMDETTAKRLIADMIADTAEHLNNPDATKH